MLLSALHPPTLFLATALVIAFSGLVLVVARGRDPDSAALALWGLAMLLGAAGISVLACGPLLGRVADLLGNVMILAGTACSWTAARCFAGRRPLPWPALAGPGLWLVAALLQGSTPQRLAVVLAFLVGGLYTLATAVELWRIRDAALRSRHWAIALLLLHAAVYIGRALGMLLISGPDWIDATDLMLLLMFEALLHTLGMAFLFLALMRERAQHRSMTKLRQLALLDGLTGIGNRRQFDQSLIQAADHARRNGLPLGLLMVDVDHFKAYNDVYGHQAGDDCLRAIAGALEGAARRPGDLAVRYGGEEFAVLLPRADEAGAQTVAELIHGRIADLGIAHAGSPQGVVTVSIGTAAMAPDLSPNRPEWILRAADHALYAAKAAGRNRNWMASQLAGAHASLRPAEPRSGLRAEGSGPVTRPVL